MVFYLRLVVEGSCSKKGRKERREKGRKERMGKGRREGRKAGREREEKEGSAMSQIGKCREIPGDTAAPGTCCFPTAVLQGAPPGGSRFLPL